MRVPQGPILGPLLFFIINVKNKASIFLNPILFANDKLLFYLHSNIITLFQKVNLFVISIV